MNKEQKDFNLEAQILDTNFNKYQLIPYALSWAKELKRKEGNPATLDELVIRALSEILTGKVKLSEIEKLNKKKEEESK